MANEEHLTIKDSQTYPTGLKVTDEDLAALNLFKEPFHGEWNYTIKPQGWSSTYFRETPKYQQTTALVAIFT